MTTLILSHRSALAYWRQAEAPATSELLDTQTAIEKLGEAEGAARLGEIRRMLCDTERLWLKTPMDLLSRSRNDRRVTSLTHIHCMQTVPPAGAFAYLANNETPKADKPELLASTPEFCFVQLASTLEIWDLIELGYELCGNYSAAQEPGGKHVSGKPVSTPQKLLDFALSASGMTGAKRARSAARWIVENASSPDEARICMLAHLPRSLGGMGSKAPMLGQHIPAPEAVTRILGSRMCSPDLYWPDAGVAVEYDARAWPSSMTRNEYESRKRNAYRMMGIMLVCVSGDDLSRPQTTRARFDLVNRKCGRRLQAPNARQRQRQESLIAWLGQRGQAQ